MNGVLESIGLNKTFVDSLAQWYVEHMVHICESVLTRDMRRLFDLGRLPNCYYCIFFGLSLFRPNILNGSLLDIATP